MDVLFLTVFLSLLLAAFFICAFYRSQKANPMSTADSESLLPFQDEKPTPLAKKN